MVQQLRTPRGRTALAAATCGAWCVVSALTVPVVAQNREHQQMAAELRILQEQQQQLAVTLAQVIESLKAIPTRIDDASAAARKGFADQELRAGSLAETVGQIRERTQDTDTPVAVPARRGRCASGDARGPSGTTHPTGPGAGAKPRSVGSRPAAPPPRRRLPRAVPRRPPRASRRRGCSNRPSRTTSPASSRLRSRASRQSCARFPARSRPARPSSGSARLITRRDDGRTPSPPTRWWRRTTPARVNVPEAYYKRGKAYEEPGPARLGARVVGAVGQDLSAKHERHAGEAGTGPLEPQAHAVIE